MEVDSSTISSITDASRPFTSVIQKIDYNINLPMGIENFLSFAGSLQNLSINSSKIYKTKNSDMKSSNVLVRLAHMSDANLIAELHQKVYKGFYPYHEMLDVQYLKKNILNPEKGYVALFGFHEKGKEKITGCGVVTTNKKTRTGYLRGLMILPKYQGKMNLKDLACTGIKYGYEKYTSNMDKWFVETRTAHSKAQFMMEVFGCRPCAILPNKDIFLANDGRESDVLDIVYADSTLYEMRDLNPILTPILTDLYNFMADRYSLPAAKFKETNIFNEQYFDVLKKAEKIIGEITMTKEKSKFNRVNYKLCTKDGSSLKFMVTRTVKSGEKAELIFKKYEDLIALLIKLDDLMKSEDIEYFELFLPATDSISQEIFLALNFSVFGYVPAWHQNKFGKLDDCIIFGKYKRNLNPRELCLTTSGYELLKVVERYLH